MSSRGGARRAVGHTTSTGATFFDRLSASSKRTAGRAFANRNTPAAVQTRFDEAAAFSNVHEHLTDGGLYFATECAELLECRNLSSTRIMITTIGEPSQGSIIDGNYFSGQPLLAYWSLSDTQSPYPSADAVIRVRLIGITGDPAAYNGLSATEQSTVTTFESIREFELHCPTHFLVVRVLADPLFRDIVEELLARGDGSRANDFAEDNRRGGNTGEEAEDDESAAAGIGTGRTKKRARAGGDSGDPGEYDDELDEPNAKLSSGLRFITDNDGIRRSVLSTNAASERLLGISLALRMMAEDRWSAYGINQHFTATPAAYRDKLEFHARPRASRHNLAAAGGTWNSVQMLQLMSEADVFKDIAVFTRVMAGDLDKRQLDAGSILSFYYLDEKGAASVEVSTNKADSTITLRSKIASAFKGFEHFLCIAMSPEYENVTEIIVAHLQCTAGDPCRGIPNAFFLFKCNECLVDMLHTLRTEQRAPDKALSGPRACREFVTARLQDLISELQAVMAEGANGHEVREFYRGAVHEMVLPKKTPGKRVTPVPPKPPRAQKGELAAAREKESTKALMAATAEEDDETTGHGHSAAETPTTLFCMFDLRYQLDPNTYKECDEARCKYDHINIRETSKEDLLAIIATSSVNGRQRAKLLELVGKTVESKFKKQPGGKPKNKKKG